MVKLIVSDIDGTLLPYGQINLRPSLFQVIEQLRERGVIFCPASGRQYHSLRGLFAPVQDELAYLCENGAILYGAGREEDAPVLGKTSMPREASLALAEDILALPGCQLLVSGANVSYVCRCTSDYVSMLKDEKGNRVQILEHPRQIEEDILKVSAYCPAGTKEPAQVLRPRWGRRCIWRRQVPTGWTLLWQTREPAWSSCAGRWESRRRRPLPLGITGTMLPCFTGLAGAT